MLSSSRTSPTFPFTHGPWTFEVEVLSFNEYDLAMQATISCDEAGGEPMVSEWTPAKSRHGKVLGIIPTPMPSSPFLLRRKKRVHETKGGASSGVLSAFQQHRQEQRQVAATIKQKRKTLPTTAYYSSNHVMINNDRVANTRRPLIRRRDLDEFARMHAQSMADSDQLFYTDLTKKLGTSATLKPGLRVGQCVVKSANLREAHLDIRESKYDRRNMLSDKWKYFGTGAAQSYDGNNLYVCYVFESAAS